MKILLVEPFFAGSHRQWAEGYQQSSRHQIEILHLKGRHWKWRMFGGAVSLAEELKNITIDHDLLLATDMLDLSSFLGLTRNLTGQLPIALYFHENQITYPWKETSGGANAELNRQYGFINYTSALAADRVYFNSMYHRQSFLEGLNTFLKAFPDRKELHNVKTIGQKSSVLYLGMDLKALDGAVEKKDNPIPVVLWNHRWEYDKGPELFFETLFRLKAEAVPFKLIVLGESYEKEPPIFQQARQELGEQIIHFGFASDRNRYKELLQMADILPVTSNQDFFGGSVVEAIHCNCYPILPKRLAFPEHIPPEKKDQHLYTSDDGFYHLLRKVLLEKPFLNSGQRYKNFVTRYDWSTLAAVYDLAFENFVKTSKNKHL